MRRHLILYRATAPPERVALAGVIVVGGTREALRLGGSPAALRFTPSAAGALVEARVPHVRAAEKPLPPLTRRLLLPGQRAECPGATVELEADPPVEGTRALAGLLLRDAGSGQPPIAGAHLVVLDGLQAGRRIPLGSSQTIGRGRSAAIRLPDSNASRVHARLCVEAGSVQVEDLGSKNGTRVNGAPLGTGTFSLRQGDEVGIGTTTLALVAADGTLAQPPPEPRALLPAAELGGGRLRPVAWLPHPTPTTLAFVGAAALLAAATALGLAAAQS